MFGKRRDDVADELEEYYRESELRAKQQEMERQEEMRSLIEKPLSPEANDFVKQHQEAEKAYQETGVPEHSDFGFETIGDALAAGWKEVSIFERDSVLRWYEEDAKVFTKTSAMFLFFCICCGLLGLMIFVIYITRKLLRSQSPYHNITEAVVTAVNTGHAISYQTRLTGKKVETVYLDSNKPTNSYQVIVDMQQDGLNFNLSVPVNKHLYYRLQKDMTVTLVSDMSKVYRNTIIIPSEY